MLKSKSAGTTGFVGAALAVLMLTAGLALALLSSAVAQAQEDPTTAQRGAHGVRRLQRRLRRDRARRRAAAAGDANRTGTRQRSRLCRVTASITVTWEASAFYYKEHLIEKERIKHALRWWQGSNWANPVGEHGIGRNDGIHVESGVTKLRHPATSPTMLRSRFRFVPSLAAITKRGQ